MKVSLILLGALAVTLIVRRRSAALRHCVLAAAVVCACAIPLLEFALPAWRLPIGRSAASVPDDATPVPAAPSPTARRLTEPSTITTRPAAEALAAISPVRWTGDDLRLVWLTGTGLSLAFLLIGMLRLTWLARRARPVMEGRWHVLTQEIAETSELQRPVILLQSDHPSLLVTWGLRHPKVILPLAAQEWSDERARVVLSHELAHIRRGDWILQIAAEVLRAFHWFNPILWMVCRRLRLESEHACDDEVLRSGVEGADYATHLVELARTLSQRRQLWLPAPAMARPSSLERRVRAMVTTGMNRRPIGSLTRVSVFAALLAVSAAIAAAQSAFVTFAGNLADAQGRGIADTSVVLSNAARQAKYEVKTNAFGRFEFIGLPDGEYGVEVRALGFRPLKDSLAVKGENLQRSYSLQLGTLQETINVRFDPSATVRREAPSVKEASLPITPQACVVGQAGGQIKPPRKIRDLVPRYPRELEGTGTDGVVVLLARIGIDGYPADISVVGEAQPELAQSAIEAVREWRYTQTLLNCQAVDVTMTITTNYVSVPTAPVSAQAPRP